MFPLISQTEFSKWYFGNQAGLDFATSPPTILTNGVLNIAEGCATVSDNLGNLLFYTDGVTIVNANNVTMANGSGLAGNLSSTQAALIVKQPGNNNNYYVFTTGTGGIMYSVVDMNLAAGAGSVIAKNIPLYASTCEKQVAVRHCNGKDVWVVSHEYNSNQFRTFLLTSAGIATNQVVSAVGETPVGGVTVIGQLKISPDGKKLAMASFTMSSPQSMGTGGFQLFDFDASLGTVSNSLTLISATDLTAGAYGVEFSPDGTKLYGSTSPGFSSYTCTLHQWNICASNNAAIIASQYSISLGANGLGSLQRAINGKIYLTVGVQSPSLSVINNPNVAGPGMNFIQDAQSVAPKQTRLGLPNFINQYIRSAPTSFTNTTACQTVTFSIPPVPSFSSGCTSTPYSPNSYLWNFGEPSSGIANTSTLTNPVHTYSTLGTYSVSLILYSNCTNDTLRNVITISALNPSLTVSGIFDICKGDKRTYTVTGAGSYKWSNNATTPTTTYSPSSTTVYSVTGTTNGCSATKVFTVNVNPCLGITAIEKTHTIRMFPNPVRDLLIIDSEQSAHIVITDLSGKTLIEKDIAAGRSEISTNGLPAGVYLVNSAVGSEQLKAKLIKIE